MTLTLNGYVVADADKWLYDYFDVPAFCPADVRAALGSVPDGEELTLEINSGGGSVFSGFEIFSLLRGAACRTVAVVQSLAASAASTIISGCSHVALSPVAQVMLHLPACDTSGNQNDHRESVRMLDSITESILNGYEAKAKGKATREKLRALMNRTSYLSAQEALDIGLADEILWQDDPSGVTNAVGVPSVASLLARYEDAVRNGAEPVRGHPVESVPPETVPDAESDRETVNSAWRAQAALALEKMRF